MQRAMAKSARRKKTAKSRGEWVKSENAILCPIYSALKMNRSRILRNVTVASNLALHVEIVEANRRRPLRA